MVAELWSHEVSLFMNVFILATSDMLERIYVTAEGSE